MSLTKIVDAYLRSAAIAAALDTIDAADAGLDEDQALRVTAWGGAYTAELGDYCVTYASLDGALLALAAAIRGGS